jgi:hypothetical protein
MSASFKLTETQIYEWAKTSSLSVLIPSCQRAVNDERVNDIYKALVACIDSGRQPHTPGCLCVAEHTAGKNLIDGQHRLLAYQRILETHNTDLAVCVNRIIVADDKEVEKLFKIVNKAVPATDLPAGVSHSAVNPIIEAFRNKAKFSQSKTGNVRCPNVHQDKFSHFIATVKLLKPELTDNEIIETINRFNTDCHMRIWTFFAKTMDDTQERVERDKAKANGFYLGLFDPDEWLGKIFGIIPDKPILRHKVKISAPLRRQVWKRFNGQSDVGICVICDCKVSVKDFHCAHDIAASKGGDISVDNLYVACSSCNLSSGTKTYSQIEAEWK